jgi:hypothetical protein
VSNAIRPSSLVLLIAAFAAACASNPAPRSETAAAPGPTQPAITAADLRSRLYVFADDSMQGREAGTQGNVKATDWLAAQARAIGLLPAGENGTYFQTVPMTTRRLDPTSSISVDGSPLVLDKDVLLIVPSEELPFGKNLQTDRMEVIYGGRVGDESAPSLSPGQLAGKLVVLDAPVDSAGKPDYQFWAHGQVGNVQGAAAIAFATLDNTPSNYKDLFRGPQSLLGAGDDLPPGIPPALLLSQSAAAKLVGAPLGGLKAGAAGRTVAANLRVIDGPSAQPARNVVAILPGGDPRLKGEYVAIGAHNDHEGILHEAVDHDSLRAFNRVLRPEGVENPVRDPDPEELARATAILDSLRALHPARRDSVYNGADDDGSGSVSVLEIAELLAKEPERPKRSILFVWHTAEEKGLFGSKYFTDHPTVPRDSIVTQLNMDMIGRGDANDLAGGGPGYIQLIGSRRLSTELGDIVEAVNKRGSHGFTFDYQFDADGHPLNYYCRSDHYMYARYGIPITFFTTGGHQDYHQVSDEVEYEDYDKMARVAELVADVAKDVADMDHRPVVDKPKPDPEAPCKQ